VNFVEELLGISPDGGNGSLEALLLLALLAGIVAAVQLARNVWAKRR
jgi:hypothetical protein